jgi:hypothetical protein
MHESRTVVLGDLPRRVYSTGRQWNDRKVGDIINSDLGSGWTNLAHIDGHSLSDVVDGFVTYI